MRILSLCLAVLIMACSENKIAGTAETENVIQADFPDSVFTANFNYQAKINYWASGDVGIQGLASQDVDLNQGDITIPADVQWWFEIRGAEASSSDSITELFWFFGQGIDSEIPTPDFKAPVYHGFSVTGLPSKEGFFFALIQGTSMIVELDGDNFFFYNLYPMDDYPIIVIYKETYESTEYEVLEGLEFFRFDSGP